MVLSVSIWQLCFVVGYEKSMKVREEGRKNINREINNFMSFTEGLGL